MYVVHKTLFIYPKTPSPELQHFVIFMWATFSRIPTLVGRRIQKVTLIHSVLYATFNDGNQCECCDFTKVTNLHACLLRDASSTG